MKLLIVTQYYYPEQFQINEIAPVLVAKGHEVTVLTGLPNYPTGVLFEGYDDPKHLNEVIQGVRVIRCKQRPRGHRVIQLILNYFSFMINSKRKIKELPNNFDAVLGYELSPITSISAALLYKRKYKVPFLMYVLDLWPVSALGKLKYKYNPLYLFLKYISRRMYSGADRLLVTSRPFIDYLSSTHHISTDKMAYLPQHAGTDMLGLDLTSEDNGIVDFMYAGNLGAGQRIEVIIEAARMLGSDYEYRVHIVGDGSRRKALEELVDRYGLTKRVFFYGNQNRTDMPQFYRMADALLITLRGNNEVGSTMPGKLQTYMTVGKPIFGAINGAASEVIRESKCGQCVEAEDAKGLAFLMKRFIELPELYKDCGANARAFFKQYFTLETFINSLQKELVSLQDGIKNVV